MRRYSLAGMNLSALTSIRTWRNSASPIHHFRKLLIVGAATVEHYRHQAAWTTCVAQCNTGIKHCIFFPL